MFDSITISGTTISTGTYTGNSLWVLVTTRQQVTATTYHRNNKHINIKYRYE
jgi:hypothetical protein